MATLYVENVPDEIYEAIRSRAKSKRTSISTEVLGLLKEHIVTPAEIARRRQLLQRSLELRSIPPQSEGPFPSTEEMQREDRAR